ncbi:signal recognition particle protein, partial [Oceanidesulfovibrio marinus]
MPVFASFADMNPVDIAMNAVAQGEADVQEVVILDTGGRVHIEENLMEEFATFQAAVSSHEILFVADACTGQDAVRV